MKMHNSDSEVQNKMINEENLVFKSGLPKEETCPSPGLVMIKTEDIVCCNGEAETKMKIKEESLVIDVGLHNEDSCLSLNTMQTKNNEEVCGTVPKVEIKEEPWWQERASPEVKCHLEVSSVSECQVSNEIKDGANEDFTATGTRLHTEAAPSSHGGTTYLFTTADLEEKDSSKCRKDNSEFVGIDIHTLLANNVVERSWREQTDQVHKTKIPCEHTQNETLDKCNNSSTEVYVSEICDNIFSPQNSSKTHIAIHNRRPYMYVCEKDSAQLGGLKTGNMIPEWKKIHKCSVCDRSFAKLGNLKKHILIHECKMPYRCHVCAKSFTLVGNLNRHILLHQDNKPYQCQVCEKRFNMKENLKRHMFIHEGKRPYHCNVCVKSFSRMGHLKQHLSTHGSEKPYKCKVCEKQFSQKRGLKPHSLIHESKRPYQCEVCEKSFAQMGNLKQHILIHEDRRPYKCDICGKRFIQKGNLKKHILIHGN